MTAHSHYAVLLRDAGAPSAEAIRRAFRTFSHLTDADAVRLAANAQGILLRQAGVDEAKALQRALLAEGVGAAVVAEEALRFLPASQLLHRIELTHDALVIFDLADRPSAVAWGEIALVAAGAVPHIEISSSAGPRPAAGWRRWFGPDSPRGGASRSRLETERQLILEFVVGAGAARYEIQAHQFPFKHVLDRPAAPTVEKFVWLVRELTRRAPGALLNRGAQDVRDGVQLVRGYPSRQLLLDEMIWLLWNAPPHPAREGSR